MMFLRIKYSQKITKRGHSVCPHYNLCFVCIFSEIKNENKFKSRLFTMLLARKDDSTLGHLKLATK